MKFYSREDWLQKAPKDLGKSACPFCTEEKDYLIWEGEHWKVIYNKYPYLGLADHIMAVPKKHIIDSADISSESYGEMKQVHTEVKRFFGEKKYFSFTRETFGDRSLEHLHMHFLPGILYGDAIRDMLQKQGF